jgi:hypothetical protein
MRKSLWALELGRTTGITERPQFAITATMIIIPTIVCPTAITGRTSSLAGYLLVRVPGFMATTPEATTSAAATMDVAITDAAATTDAVLMDAPDTVITGRDTAIEAEAAVVT